MPDLDEKGLEAAVAAVWDEHLYHIDSFAYGQNFTTPDTKAAQRFARTAITAYLTALSPSGDDRIAEPEAWQYRWQDPDGHWSKWQECESESSYDASSRPTYMRAVETRPLYTHPNPDRIAELEKALDEASDEISMLYNQVLVASIPIGSKGPLAGRTKDIHNKLRAARRAKGGA